MFIFYDYGEGIMYLLGGAGGPPETFGCRIVNLPRLFACPGRNMLVILFPPILSVNPLR